jgi:hypothetical protein
MRTIFTLLLAFASLPVLAADREDVLLRLQGYEWSLSEAGLKDLGSETAEVLLDIANDEEVFVVVRERAIAALTLFPRDEVFTFYLEQIETSQTQARKRRVVESICVAFWTVRPGDVESVFVPLLKSDDIHLRTKVARCMKDSQNRQTRDALNAYFASIELPWEAEAAGYDKR